MQVEQKQPEKRRKPERLSNDSNKSSPLNTSKRLYQIQQTLSDE